MAADGSTGRDRCAQEVTNTRTPSQKQSSEESRGGAGGDELDSGHDPEGFFPEGNPDHFSDREVKIPKSIVGDGDPKRDLSFQGLEVDKTISAPIDNVNDFTGKNVVP